MLAPPAQHGAEMRGGEIEGDGQPYLAVARGGGVGRGRQEQVERMAHGGAPRLDLGGREPVPEGEARGGEACQAGVAGQGGDLEPDVIGRGRPPGVRVGRALRRNHPDPA